MTAPVKFLVAALFLSVLVACTEMRPVQREASPVRVAKTCHKRIALAGRFSVHYRKDGKEESLHGSFRWGQDNDHAHIVLMSPLGDTQAVIDVTPDVATLTSSGKITRTADDVDALALEALGWPMPVSGLRDWIQACMHNEQGRRVVVTPESRELATSDGWRITYPVWEDDGQGRRRPKRIDLHRSDREWAEISVRLIVDEWMPHP